MSQPNLLAHIQNQRLEAIKRCREITGVDLDGAREVVFSI